MTTRGTRKRLSTVAAEGDRLSTLEKLRDVIAKSVEDTAVSDRDRVSFVTQLRHVLKEIEEIKASRGISQESNVPVNVLDEIAKRRNSRAS